MENTIILMILLCTDDTAKINKTYNYVEQSLVLRTFYVELQE